MVTARSAALSALIQFRREGSWTDLFLKKSLSSLSREDAALASAITYSVLQNMYLIDFYISQYSSIKINKIMPQVLDAMRCGVCQILFMDKIPVFASVNETVSLIKKTANPRAAAFANAVLRKIADSKDSLPCVPNNDHEKYLSVRYSHPLLLVKKLLNQFGGAETEKLLSANNTHAPQYIRTNTQTICQNELIKKLQGEGITADAVNGVPGALLCNGSVPLHLTDCFKKGLFYIQDLASQLAVYLLQPQPGDSVIDMCAAPGGKSLAAASIMQNKGQILSFDLYEHKIKLIEQNAEKYQASIINASVSDSCIFDPSLESSADRVICDVPCSGLGIIRKKPDIRYKNIDQIENLPDIQLKILNNAAKYLKKGGRLVYSTCTILQKENRKVVDKFLSERDDFFLSPFDNPLTGYCCGDKLLLPHINNCDGFYIAVLDRK